MRATQEEQERRLLKHLRHCARHWRRHGVVPSVRQVERTMRLTTNMSGRDRIDLVEAGLLEHPPESDAFVITPDGWAVLRREFPGEFGHVGDKGQDLPTLDEVFAARGLRRIAVSPAPVGAGLHRSAVETTVAEEAEDYVVVPEIVSLPAGELFVAEVDGDSMVDAHILPGDRVFLRRTDTAYPGQIVAAQLEDGTITIKRFDPRGSKVLLHLLLPTPAEAGVQRPVTQHLGQDHCGLGPGFRRGGLGG